MRISLNSFIKISCLLFLSLVAFISTLLMFSSSRIVGIQDSWWRYQLDRAEKPRLESVLSANIGYGGMIHYFKNYIIRQDDYLFDMSVARIGAARSAIQQYYSIGTNEAEMIALNDIDEVLLAYMVNLNRAVTMIKQGMTPELIDKELAIDDRPALRGLQILRNEVANNLNLPDQMSSQLNEAVEGRIVEELYSTIGFGGMIHSYKNAVLRKDISAAENARNDIVRAKQIIRDYRALPTSVAEEIALDDIASTLADYSEKLILLISTLQDNPEVSVQELDQLGKVDDTIAFRGLNTLSLEISRKVGELSAGVNSGLQLLVQTVPLINVALVITLGLVILIFARFIYQNVIKPIQTLSWEMRELLSGNLDISITGSEGNTEFAEMARGMELIRQSMLERNDAIEKVKKMAATDPLTGLGNRAYLNAKLRDYINVAKRNKRFVAVIVIDLDHFKPVNDEYGHTAGDKILIEVGKRLMKLMRETDFVGRLGGDEFVVIASDIEEKKNIFLPVSRISDQLQLPHYMDNEKIFVGGSVGYSIYPNDGAQAEELLHKADVALYKAKESTTGKIIRYEEDKQQSDKAVCTGTMTVWRDVG